MDITVKRASWKSAAIVGLLLCVLASSAAAQDVPSTSDFGTNLRSSIPSIVERIVRDSGPVPAPAQDASTNAWTALQARPEGTRVTVEQLDGSRLPGRLKRATNDAITIATDAGDAEVPRDRVRAIRVSSPTRRVVYGAIGVTAGVIGGWLLCPYCTNEGHTGVTAKLMVGGGALGSLLFLPDYTTVVYRAPAPSR